MKRTVKIKKEVLITQLNIFIDSMGDIKTHKLFNRKTEQLLKIIDISCKMEEM